MLALHLDPEVVRQGLRDGIAAAKSKSPQSILRISVKNHDQTAVVMDQDTEEILARVRYRAVDADTNAPAYVIE